MMPWRAQAPYSSRYAASFCASTHMRSPLPMPRAARPSASASTRRLNSLNDRERSPWMTAGASPYTHAPRAIIS
jgi:hypothetical protein